MTVSTASATLTIRIGIRANTTKDLDRLRALQDASTSVTNQPTPRQNPPCPTPFRCPCGCTKHAWPHGNTPSRSQTASTQPTLRPLQTESESTSNVLTQAGQPQRRLQHTQRAPPSTRRVVAAAAPIATNPIEADLSGTTSSLNLGNNYTIPVPACTSYCAVPRTKPSQEDEYQEDDRSNSALRLARVPSTSEKRRGWRALNEWPGNPALGGRDRLFRPVVATTISGKPRVTGPRPAFWNIGSYDAERRMRLAPQWSSQPARNRVSDLQPRLYIGGGPGVYGYNPAGA